MQVISIENEALRDLMKYGSVLLLKMICMSILTSAYRAVYQSFPVEEDAKAVAGEDKEMQRKLLVKNPNVERIRLAHLNDLENIVPFFIISMLYIASEPSPQTAKLLFQIFVGSRFAHTVIYLNGVRQPLRGIAFTVGFLVNFYMAIQVLLVSAW
ncbi:microsomal glutathione S-transferase 1-like [Styela clava]